MGAVSSADMVAVSSADRGRGSRAPCRAASRSTRVNMPSNLQLLSTRTAPEPSHNVFRRVPEARSSCRAQA